MGSIIQVVFIYLTLIGGGIFVATNFNKKIETGLPLAPMLIILILYIFGILNMLYIGFIICCCLIAFAYGISLYKFIRSNEKNEIIKNIVTVPLIVFTIAMFIIICICKSNQVLWWDELRLWGAYPKIMYYTDRLASFRDSIMWDYMKPYPPALALLQYFCLRVSTEFKDAFLFIIYYSFGLTLIVQIFNKIKIHEIVKVLIAIIVAVLLPYIFFYTADTSVAYTDIMVDCIFALMFGFSLYNIFLKDEIGLYDILIYSFVLFIITITKPIGILFALISLALYLLDTIVLKVKFSLKQILENIKNNLSRILLPLLAIMTGYWSWKIFIDSQIERQGLSSSVLGSSFFNNIFHNQPDYFDSVFSSFINHHLNTPSIGGYFTLSQFLILFIILIFLANIIINKNKKRLYLYTVTMAIFLFLYLLSLLYTYLYAMTEYEAIHLISLSRYSNTYLCGMALFASAIIYDILPQKFKDYKSIIKEIIIIKLLLFLVISILFIPTDIFKRVFIKIENSTYICHELALADVMNIRESVLFEENTIIHYAMDREMLEENFPCDITLMHHYTFYKLIPYNINLVLPWENMDISYLDYIQYIYFVTPLSEADQEQMRIYFNFEDDYEVESKILYRVERGETINLIRE